MAGRFAAQMSTRPEENRLQKHRTSRKASDILATMPATVAHQSRGSHPSHLPSYMFASLEPAPADDPADGKRKPQDDYTGPRNVISGDGMHTAMVRQTASFTIEARDVKGMRMEKGGLKYMVAVRGSSTVRARVTDNQDGTYLVEYKPSTSGTYSISVSLRGVQLPDCPLRVEVLRPAPQPDKCILRGDALTKARARELATFEVEFVDALGQPCAAEELDVWVERADEVGLLPPAIASSPAAAP